MSIISITGHRPEAIEDMVWVRTAMREAYVEMGATKIIQGMAAGVDLWSAAEAYNLGLPYIAARPWATHASRISDKVAYSWVIDHAESVVDVSDAIKYPGKYIYHVRNKYMVDNAEAVLAIWDGSVYGGTYDCFKYALSVHKPIYRIDPKRKIVKGWVGEA